MQPDFGNAIAVYGLQSRVHLVGPLHGRDKFAAHADSGLVVPHDVTDIASALFGLMADPERHRMSGADGRAYFADKLTPAAVARAMIENFRRYESFCPSLVPAGSDQKRVDHQSDEEAGKDETCDMVDFQGEHFLRFRPGKDTCDH